MKKQTKQKFKNIWNKIKKPLMIFSFIFNIIFIIFIIVGCATIKKDNKTINSNEKETQEVIEEDTSSIEEYFPELKRNNLRFANEERVTDLTNTTWLFKDEIEPYSSTSTIDWKLRYKAPYSPYTSTTLSSFICPTISNGSVANTIRLSAYQYGMYYRTVDTWYTGQNGEDGNGWYTYAYNNQNVLMATKQNAPTITFLGGDDVTNTSFINWLYDNAYKDGIIPEPEPEPEEPTEEYEILDTIYLGDNFVPSVYVCDNGEFLFNGFASHHENADTFVLILDGFTFISNGEKFNTISIPFVSVGAGAPYVTQDGVNLLDTSNFASSYMFPLGLLYQYREDNNVISSVRVSSNRRYVIDAGSNNLVNSYDIRVPFMVWINDNYRTLDVIENEETIISGSMLTINNKTSVELLSVTSNVSTSAVGISDVNTLLKGAFSSLSSLFGLTILPGLTLGLLLFLPLVVTILIAVIRLIRK